MIRRVLSPACELVIRLPHSGLSNRIRIVQKRRSCVAEPNKSHSCFEPNERIVVVPSKIGGELRPAFRVRSCPPWRSTLLNRDPHPESRRASTGAHRSPQSRREASSFSIRVIFTFRHPGIPRVPCPGPRKCLKSLALRNGTVLARSIVRSPPGERRSGIGIPITGPAEIATAHSEWRRRARQISRPFRGSLGRMEVKPCKVRQSRTAKNMSTISMSGSRKSDGRCSS